MALSKQMACNSNDAGVGIGNLFLEGLNFTTINLQILLSRG